jgi:pimeloyl-ACP methyl ester carboxylesterase
MATNLRPDPRGGYSWHFDLAALEEMLEDYWRYDGWPFLEDAPRSLAIHCVRAGRSDRFTADDVARLEALDDKGKLALHVLKDAGHWLHVDDPAGLLRIALEFVG